MQPMITPIPPRPSDLSVRGSDLPHELIHRGAGPQPDPFIGRTIGAGYIVAELVGRGGMGRVYRARQEALDRDVAIKVLHPHLLGDEASVARFHTEARAASRLNHPNSVAVIDFGLTEDQVPFLVMELLTGMPLRRSMRPEAPVPIERAVWVALEVLSALDEAHALGVIHRDLKPENIFLVPRRDGTDLVKVVDFGLAHINEASGVYTTRPGAICGTPGYTAPERWLGEPVDGRADLYSLGAILFELISGRSPFEGDRAQQMLMQLTGPAPSLTRRFPGRRVSPVLDEVIMQALAVRPAERFGSADAMADALLDATEGMSVDAPPGHACAGCGGRGRTSSRGRTTASRVVATSSRSLAPAEPAPQAPQAQPARTWLGELRRVSRGTAIVVLTGPSGAGKSSRLRRLFADGVAAGNTVYRTGAHPSGVPLPYWTVRSLARTITGLDDAGLRALRDGVGPRKEALSSLERAGLAELLSHQGLSGMPGAGRAAAVAGALEGLLRAATSPEAGGLVLLVDDADRCDALSLVALSRLAWFPTVPGGPPRLVVLAAGSPVPVELVGAAAHVALERADGEARAARLGGALLHLSDEARAVAEAAAVLGPSAPLEGIEALVGPVSRAALAELGPLTCPSPARALALVEEAREQLVTRLSADRLAGLNDRALAWAERERAPLELRAHYAGRGTDAFMALVLLEQVGTRAMARGDPGAAAGALRRALDLARQALGRTGDEVYADAVLTFSERLADALRAGGRALEAEGVLGEVVERASESPARKARLLLALGQLAAASGNHDLARGHLALALSLDPDTATAACIHQEMSMLARAAGDLSKAFLSIRAGERLLAEAPGPLDALGRLRLALCSLLAEGDQNELALIQANVTLEGLQGANLPALEAEVHGLVACVSSRLGMRAGAARALREATRLSAEAGDVEGNQRWLDAARIARGVNAPG
jgi:eukaryotic-like serine/threonine-protein kinase